MVNSGEFDGSPELNSSQLTGGATGRDVVVCKQVCREGGPKRREERIFASSY
jgi:hypothetical protein